MLEGSSRIDGDAVPVPRRSGHDLVEEVGVSDPVVDQVDVGPQGEARVSVSEPLLHLLDVAARVEEQRRAGVPERMEADRRALVRLAVRALDLDVA
jgi:hypothetical protein